MFLYLFSLTLIIGVNGLTNGFALQPITTINEDEDDEESTALSFIDTPGKSGRVAGKETKLSDINLATAIYQILCSNEFIHAIMDEEGSFDTTGDNNAGMFTLVWVVESGLLCLFMGFYV